MAGESFLLKIIVDVQNDQALQALASKVKQTGDALPKAAKAADDFGRKNKRMGNIAQNVGYQVQDFIVQVQGGQDPLRSLSQQLPQLTVGFGAAGAAIGIVGALIPALISAFSAAEDATLSWDDALSNTSDAIDRLGSVSESFDLDNWVDAFNEANAAGQALLQTSLELELIDLQKAGRDLSKALPETGGKSLQGYAQLFPFLAPFVDSEVEALDKYALSLGITREEAEKLNEVYEQARRGGVTAPGATTEAIALLEKYKLQMGGLTDESEAQLSALRELKAAQDKYNIAVGRSGQAAAGYGVVLDEVEAGGKQRSTSGGGGSGGKGRDRTQEILRKRLAAVNAQMEQADRILKGYVETQRLEQEQLKETLQLWEKYNPELAKYVEEVNSATAAKERGILTDEQYNKILQEQKVILDQGLEGWTLQGEAIEIFQDSFDTMLNGVLMGTQDIASGFEDMAKVIIAQILKLIAYQAIASAFGGTTFGNAFANGGRGIQANAKGNAFSGGNVIPFARGGVVNGPTLFPMAKGMGLMGEAGPEAVMPLGRNSKGELGVKGGGVNVTINNMASGVDVIPRQTDQGLTIDVVMRAVATAFQQGGNVVSDSAERAYGLGRGRAVY